MRRLLFAATVVGLAVGAALNLLAWPQQPPTGTDAAVSVEPQKQDTATPGPASHRDSNTSGYLSYLNPNVIEGQTTRVCTIDRDLEELVANAIKKWNTALSARLCS